MPMVTQVTPFSAGTLLLILGALGLYVASRAAADALARRGRDARPSAGRMALGHWTPIVLVASFAAVAGRADLALGVLFGTTVAAVSLALGIITYLTPPASLPPSRRAWPFLLAAALLILIAGFGSRLTLTHALMLAALGAAVLAVWRGAAAEEDNVPVAQLLSDLAGPEEGRDPPPPQQPPGLPRAESKLRFLQWALAAGLAAAAAKAVIDGATSVDGSSRLLRAAILAAGVISPLLLLPALATGTDLAQRGRSGEACGGLVGLALLNLCALLPVVIVLWYVQSAIPGGGGLRGFAHRLVREGEPLPLPLSIWRIDVVVLVVVGFALLPAALGRWFIGRLESAGLILGYAAYLAATAAINVRL